MGLIVAVLHGHYKFFIFMAHASSIDNFDRLMEIMLPFSAGIELTEIETSAYRNSKCIHDLPNWAIASWGLDFYPRNIRRMLSGKFFSTLIFNKF
ncbi:hypothetical protein [Desulfococcus multivorans]|uniref:hypothetical protein n=1 Tax=Desulfococcus multivorans TaxID=897 RepID=UPI00058F5CAD|nr:hypothetical protein [Desulfococcus multivorans]AQV02542.1 hypothetical protein B2D07_18385 [Desulfococcus multivorans]